MPFAASEGIGWVNTTVKGKQTVKVGKTKEPVVNAQMHVMVMFPAGIIHGATQPHTNTDKAMSRAAVR